MRSLLNLAENYELLADHNDAIVEEILSGIERCGAKVRDAQLLQASLLAEEARFFRERATQLRAPIIRGRHTSIINTDGHA
jgi:hypothetical protein